MKYPFIFVKLFKLRTYLSQRLHQKASSNDNTVSSEQRVIMFRPPKDGGVGLDPLRNPVACKMGPQLLPKWENPSSKLYPSTDWEDGRLVSVTPPRRLFQPWIYIIGHGREILKGRKLKHLEVPAVATLIFHQLEGPLKTSVFPVALKR